MLHVLSSLQANEIYSESLKIGATWQWDPVQSFRLSGRSVILKDLTGYWRSDLAPWLWKYLPFDMRGKKEKMRKEKKVRKKRRQRKWWLEMKVGTDISLVRKIKGLWTKLKIIIIIVDCMPRDSVDRKCETADNIPEFLCSFSSFMNVLLVILQV